MVRPPARHDLHLAGASFRRLLFVDLQDGSWGPWTSRTFRAPPVTSETIGRISPSEGAQVAILTPTVRWANTRSDVFYYEVQLSTDPTFNTDPASATAMVYWELRHGGVTIPSNSYMVPQDFPLQVGEKYCWRVRPRIQGDGTPLEWSKTFSFRTPSTPPPATATPTVTRTPTLTPTGTPPTATPTGAVGTPTVTGAPTPTPAALGQVLVNGSFDGSGGWISDCNCVSSASVSGGWRSGSKGGYVVPPDGYAAANLYQIVTLPANASSITFSYYYQLHGTDANADDCFVAGVLEGSTVLVSRQRCVAQGYQGAWASGTFNITAHRGKTVIVLFGMTTQSANNHKNYALLDDTSVLAQ